MDEEDSQDELINRNASQGKGKRAAGWDISGSEEDSDEAGEEMEDEESESGDDDDDDDDEEDQLNGEDEEMEEEEEDDSDDDDDDDEEEEDSGKAVEGAVAGVSADPAGLSSDEDSEKCPICLNSFHSQPVATPESCEHYFCLDCILEWSKNANSCPVDRIVFNNIYLRKNFGGKVQKMITVHKPVKEGQEEQVDLELEQTSCEVCGGRDREDRLLLCDGCDAGYHMECLTPPLDAVPVEEWFCPGCEANNHRSRGSAEDQSEAESQTSDRPTTSRSRSAPAGPTRAIARTQQSERVRANVNRHRITQARTAQLAPRFLMQSTWLDDTINAVVAGLNTAVYVRNLTPRPASSRRRRRTVKRRKGKKSTVSGEKGKAAGTGVKRRRRKRRTKSRRKLVVKKQPTSRGRIARSLGIAKPKKGSTLPSVYRPSDHSLGSMRADIGAASFSVYGDPFDLDPFDNGEEEEDAQTQVTSLLDAKRRGLSRSALRSHQPVARPITAGLSRRGLDQSQAEEAAPVPDLLGSILSGQSMLLMDSSDVVINRDGSLKAVKPVSMSSPSMPGSSRSSSSGETGVTVGPGPPGQSPNPGPSFGDQAGPSYSPLNTALPLGSPGPSSSPRNPSPPSPRLTNHSHPPASSHPSSLGHPRLQPAPPSHRPSHGAGLSHRATNGVGPPHRGHPSTSSPGSPSKGREAPPPQSQAKKAAPPKPVWVDVSVLPRIPKIKRETNGSDGTTRGGSSSNGFPESGVQSLAGDRGRRHSVDQPQGRQEEQAARHRPGPSPAFANSFSSSSSSSSGSPGNPLRSSSSSSSTICFRINSSGSAWHACSLSNASATAAGSSEEEEAAKRRSRSKPKLAGLHAPVKEEPGERDVYDPFHPTGSESNGSDSEPESRAADYKSQHARSGSRLPDVGSKAGFRKQVKAEALEKRISPEGEGGSGDHVKVKKEPEPSGIRDCGGTNRSPQRVPETVVTRSTSPLRHRLVPLKTEKPEPADENSIQTQTSISCLQRRAPSTSAPTSASSLSGEKKLKTEVKPEPGDSPARSPSRSSGRGRQVSGGSGASREQQSASSSPEPGERRRGGHPESGQGGRRRGEEQSSGQAGRRRGEEGRERRSRRSGSRERRRRSPSDSPDSGASDRSHRKKRRSHSRDGRRSRSGSDSSSREPGKSKKPKRRSRERGDDREGGRDRGCVAREKRYARSRSRSTSRERRQDHPRPRPSSSGSKGNAESRSRDRERPQSRSRSRERRKEEGSSKGSSKKTAPSLSTSDFSTEQQGRKSEKKASGTSSAKERPERETKREASSSDSGPTPLSVSGVKEEKNHSDVRPDSCASAKPIKETKMAKAIKKERLTCFDIFGEESPDDEPVPAPAPVKDEKPPASSLSAIKDFYLKKEKEIKKERMCSPKNEPCSSATSDKEEQVSIATIKVKTEPLWPDLSIGSGVPPPPPPPALVLPFTSPNPTPAPLVAVPADVPPPPPVPKVKTETPAGAPPGPLTLGPPGEEPSDSDEEFNVDVMLDNLDMVKREKAAETEGVPAGSEVKQERKEVKTEGEEVKTEGEPVPVLAGAKSKAPVKRVTWNIQEPEGPQPERTGSKLALYKLKLKQEGARRPSSNQDPSGARNLAPAGLPIPGQGQSTAALSEARTTDEPRNDKYMKKLHMQERAVEEVKLAIKPFYQKRDITKDEYKEILRKAVQKVCHSKSGEINPVKVANLVKAYVDKYKHARKHGQGREDEEPAQGPETEGAKDSESP